jgi:hypothetical protein
MPPKLTRWTDQAKRRFSRPPTWPPPSVPCRLSGRTRRSERRRLGSSPGEGACAGGAGRDLRPPCKRETAGSSPAAGSLPAQHDRSCAVLVRRRQSVRARPLALHGLGAGAQSRFASLTRGVRLPDGPRRTCLGSPNGRGRRLRPGVLQVRLLFQVRTFHGGAEQLECSRSCQDRDRGFESRRHRVGELPERQWGGLLSRCPGDTGGGSIPSLSADPVVARVVRAPL